MDITHNAPKNKPAKTAREKRKHEKDINKILSGQGQSNLSESWFTTTCAALGNRTPREVIDAGHGQLVLDMLNRVLKHPIKPIPVDPLKESRRGAFEPRKP